MVRQCFFPVLCGLIAAAVPVSSTGASTTVAMPIESLADHAGQVIVGEVASVRSYFAGNPRRIDSQITFNQVRYLKGSHPGATRRFRLIVPGGTVGTLQMHISDTPRFEVGETWLLFLLPGYRTYPVVGLSQGAFQIRAGRVFRGDLPVTGLDENGFIQVARPDTRRHRNLVAGPSASGPPEADVGAMPDALTYRQFERKLRPILRASRDHKMVRAAGRPLAVRHTPTPLKIARRVSPRAPAPASQERSTAPPVQPARRKRPR